MTQEIGKVQVKTTSGISANQQSGAVKVSVNAQNAQRVHSIQYYAGAETTAGIGNQANAAYAQANAGYIQANSAYESSNVSNSLANAAYAHANAAFELANTDYRDFTSTLNQANAAYDTANASYGTANSAYITANSGYTQANIARTHANAAYELANVSYSTGYHANLAWSLANSAYSTGNASYDTANAGYSTANAGYSTANASYETANAGYSTANAAYDTANLAYETVNATTLYATSGFEQANLARNQANAAYDTANAGYSTANAGYSTANASYDTANAGYSIANAGYSTANAGYSTANASYGTANAAYDTANASYDTANAGYSIANAAYAQANASYGNANTKVSKSGDVMTGNLAIEISEIGYFNAITVANTDGLQYVLSNNGDQTVYGQANVRQKLSVGTGAYYPLPQLIAQFTADAETYSQVNQQNLNANGSGDMVITADNGTDLSMYTDMGKAGSTYNYYGEGALIQPNDSYLIGQGSDGQREGSNVLIMATTSGYGDIVFAQGGAYKEHEVARFVYGQGFTIKTQTPSTSNSTGALVVEGGIGANGAIHADSIYINNDNVANRLNSAFAQANLAYRTGYYANTAWTHANAAYTFANTTYASVVSYTNSVLTQNTVALTAYINSKITENVISQNSFINSTVTDNVIAANAYVNSALTANVLTINTSIDANVVAANLYVNSAISDNVVAANLYVNSALTSNVLTINTSIDQNVASANAYVNSAIKGNVYALNASILANVIAANAYVNSALTANVLTINSSIDANVIAANNYVNSALTSNVLTINSSIDANVVAANLYVNSALTANVLTINTSIDQNVATLNSSITTNSVANYAHANAAYNLANTALQNTTGIFAGSLEFTGNVAVDGNISIGTYADFSTGISAPEHFEGRVFYDNDQKALAYYNESAMTGQILQEAVVRVWNNTANTITDGKAVYVSGVSSANNFPSVDVGGASNYDTSEIIGVTTTTIPPGGYGYVTTKGKVGNLDTSLYVEGHEVYLDNTGGGFIGTAPATPSVAVRIGTVVHSDATDGVVLVDISFREGVNMTTGSLVFAYNEHLYEDPENLYWDYGQNRLGIGTNTPQANLHVVGSGLFTGNVIISGNLLVSNAQSITTTELTVGGNTIVLNSEVTGSPTTNAEIVVNRGTENNVFIRWDESIKEWTMFEDNTYVGHILHHRKTATTWDEFNAQAPYERLRYPVGGRLTNNVSEHAIAGYITANSAFATGYYANTAWNQANSAYAQGNTTILNTNSYITSNVLTINTSIDSNVSSLRSEITANAVSANSVIDTNISANVAILRSEITANAVSANSVINSRLSSNVATLNASITSNIATANLFTQSAFDLANTAVQRAGDTMTGALSITNATNSTGHTTGALKVTGGVGVTGNVYVGDNSVIGFSTGSGTVKVYQVYNAGTNSLDTIFV